MQKRVTEADEAEDARRTEIEYQKRKIKQGTAPRPDGSVLSGLDILRHAFKNDEEAKRMAKVALGAAGLGAGIAAPLLIPSAPILSGAVINALTGIPMNYLLNAPEGVAQDTIAGAIAGAVVPKYGMAAALPAMLASYAATATPEAEAGSIKGVKSLVNKKLWPLVDRLFSEAPGSAAFTDEMLAKAINSGERILPMRAGNFRSATFEPMFYTSDDPEYVKLLNAAKLGALKNMPWLEVDRNRIGGHIIPFISGHDGRHRLQAVESVFGDVNSPVIIQPNKHIKTIKKDVYLPQAAYEDVGVVDVGELYNYNDGFSLGIDPGKFIKGPKGPGLEYTDKGEWVEKLRAEKAQGGPVKMSQGGRMLSLLRGKGALPAYTEGATYGRSILPTSVVKQKGGNWLSGSVEGALSGLKKPPQSGRIAIPKGQEAAWPRGQWLEYDNNGVPTLMRISETGATETIPLGTQQVNNWIEGPLTKYIKNQMATPEDPLRLMADAWPEKKAGLQSEIQKRLDKAMADMEKARVARGFTPEMMTRSQARINELLKEKALIDAQDALHFEPQWGLTDRVVKMREASGFPIEGLGKSDLAKNWESMSDRNLRRELGVDLSAEERALLMGGKPVPKDAVAYSIRDRDSYRDLGFDHLIDELRNATNPASGLPRDLQIDPKDLGRMNVKDAAERVARINAYRAVQKAEANAALARNPATFDFKDYPDTDYKWVQLRQPQDVTLPTGYSLRPEESASSGKLMGYRVLNAEGKPIAWGDTEKEAIAKTSTALQDALKYEGDTMQTCVGGYCDKVLGGQSQIYSLRNKKTGEPHVTIEVGPKKGEIIHDELELGGMIDDESAEADQLFRNLQRVLEDRGYQNAAEIVEREAFGGRHTPEIQRAVNEAYVEAEAMLPRREVPKETPLSILQIKGKKNLKPDDKFLPFVQDFVRSGKWSDVGDLHNTGLSHRSKLFTNAEIEELHKRGGEAPEWLTDAEHSDLLKKYWPENYASGGTVHSWGHLTPEPCSSWNIFE
jgi:hypothetical protein